MEIIYETRPTAREHQTTGHYPGPTSLTSSKQDSLPSGWWVLKELGQQARRSSGTSKEAAVREACGLIGIRYHEVPVLRYRTVGLVDGGRAGGEIEQYPELVIVSNLVTGRRAYVSFKWPRARGGVV